MVAVTLWVIEVYASPCRTLSSSLLSDATYLAGWVLEGGVGARSVKTCSVRGPGRTVVASGSLGPGSGTSVASVASSVDWDGFTFPLAVAATSPVEREVSWTRQRKRMCR